MRKCIQFVIILLHLFAVHSAAANYYVSATDGNDALSGLTPEEEDSENGPFRTIGKAASVVLPGDTVFIREGTYLERVVIERGGVEGQPVVYTHFPGESPVISVVSWNGSYAFNLKNVSHVQIIGLTFANAPEDRKAIAGDSIRYCTIDRCTFIGNEGFAAVHLFNGSSDNVITNCRFENTGTKERLWDTHLYLDRCGPNNVIKYNIFTQTDTSAEITDKGVWCSRTSETVIAHNIFTRLTRVALSIGIESDIYQVGEPVPQRNIISDNEFYGNLGISCQLVNVSHSIVRNCTFHENRGAYTLLIQGQVSQNNLIEYNRLWENWSLTKLYSDQLSIYSAGNGNTIRGNEIFGQPDSSAFRIVKGYTALNVQQTPSVVIIDNDIHDINYPATVDKSDYNPAWVKTPEQGGRAGHGIYIDGVDVEMNNVVIRNNRVNNVGASAISASHINNSLIQGNTCSHNGAWGISVQGQNNIIEHNTCYENGWMHGGCSGINVHGQSRNNIARYNLSYNNHQGTAGEVGYDWWDDGNGIIADQGADSTFIYNNICWGNEGAGIALTASSDCFVFNNTLVRNGYCEHAGHKAGLAVVSTPEANRYARRETIIGNILFDNANRQLIIADIADNTHVLHHNLYAEGPHSANEALIHYRDETLDWTKRDFYDIETFRQYWLDRGDSLNASGSVDADPLLACGSSLPDSAEDVYLAPKSPARDASTPLDDYFQDDYAGTIRPLNGAWDMGAFEAIRRTSYFVSADRGEDYPLFGSQARPFKSLSYALNQVLPGDSILVDDGIYNTRNGNSFPLRMVSGVYLQGSGGPNNCIIDAEGTTHVFVDSACSANTTITGFTITGGHAQGEQDVDASGGAILCIDGDSTAIVGNILKNNRAGHYGGAIYCYLSSPLVKGNKFIYNQANYRGAALYEAGYAPRILSNVFYGNSCRFYGGAIFSAGQHSMIGDNIIENNSAALSGGGIYLNGPETIVRGNTIVSNRAKNGAGIAVNGADAVLTANMIYGNMASESGNDLFAQTGLARADSNFWGICRVQKTDSLAIERNIFRAADANLDWWPPLDRPFALTADVTDAADTLYFADGVLWFQQLSFNESGAKTFSIISWPDSAIAPPSSLRKWWHLEPESGIANFSAVVQFFFRNAEAEKANIQEKFITIYRTQDNALYRIDSGVDTLAKTVTGKPIHEAGTFILGDFRSADHLTVVSGNDQRGSKASVLPEPVVVRAEDINSDPIPNQIVTFQHLISDGYFNPPTDTTDRWGRARSYWHLSTQMGTNRGLAQIANTTIRCDLEAIGHVDLWLDYRVTNISIADYQTARRSVGDSLYIDLADTIVYVPENYQNALWLLTADRDRTSSDANFLSFNVNKETRVTIGYDASQPQPSWLTDWQAKETIIHSSTTLYHLYDRIFRPGTISLAGNAGALTSKMYLILLQPFTTDRTAPTSPAAVTMISLIGKQ